MPATSVFWLNHSMTFLLVRATYSPLPVSGSSFANSRDNCVGFYSSMLMYLAQVPCPRPRHLRCRSSACRVEPDHGAAWGVSFRPPPPMRKFTRFQTKRFDDISAQWTDRHCLLVRSHYLQDKCFGFCGVRLCHDKWGIHRLAAPKSKRGHANNLPCSWQFGHAYQYARRLSSKLPPAQPSMTAH
jgi:hypothetical protein